MKKFVALTAILLTFCLVLCSCGSASTDNTPSLSDGEVQINNLILTLPDGFTLREVGGIKVACCPEYPEKADNISFATSGKDSPDAYTKERLDEMNGSLVAGFSGSNSLDNYQIDGCKVLIYSYNLILDEKPLTAVQYMVFGSDFTDVITVTLSSVESFSSIEQMIKSARLK